MNCVSCNHVHEEKYCPNCGEKSGVKRITLTTMTADVFSSVTNMDRGFLYNLKTLTLAPQKVAKDFILGKRKGIFNPVSYLIFAITIYIIVITVIDSPKEKIGSPETTSLLRLTAYEVGLFIRAYLKYFWILAIVPLALSLRLVYRNYNFMEHLATSSFIIGHATLASVLSYLIFDTILIFDPVVYFVIFWLIHKIYRTNNSTSESAIIAFSVALLFILLLVIIVIAIGAVKVMR